MTSSATTSVDPDFLAVLVLITAGIEAALHVDLGAFGEVGRDVFPAPEMMLDQLVSSFHSPDCWSFQRRLVATENLVTAVCEAVKEVSASRPRFPSRITLLTLRLAILSNFTTGGGQWSRDALPVSARFLLWSSILLAQVARVDSYRVVTTYPHDPGAFTQGLEYVDGRFYEGTGLNGQSTYPHRHARYRGGGEEAGRRLHVFRRGHYRLWRKAL